jgi:hypothetical protein
MELLFRASCLFLCVSAGQFYLDSQCGHMTKAWRLQHFTYHLAPPFLSCVTRQISSSFMLYQSTRKSRGNYSEEPRLEQGSFQLI